MFVEQGRFSKLKPIFIGAWPDRWMRAGALLDDLVAGRPNAESLRQDGRGEDASQRRQRKSFHRLGGERRARE